MSGPGIDAKCGMITKLRSVIRTFNHDYLLSHLP